MSNDLIYKDIDVETNVMNIDDAKKEGALAFFGDNKESFLNEKIVKNPYLIRIIGSNIGLDRFYSDNQTENIINELINLSSPEPYKKTFFLS